MNAKKHNLLYFLEEFISFTDFIDINSESLENLYFSFVEMMNKATSTSDACLTLLGFEIGPKKVCMKVIIHAEWVFLFTFILFNNFFGAKMQQRFMGYESKLGMGRETILFFFFCSNSFAGKSVSPS